MSHDMFAMRWPVVRNRRNGTWYHVGWTHIGPPAWLSDALKPIAAVKINDEGPYWWKYAPIGDEL
jgi:hypothetical protein